MMKNRAAGAAGVHYLEHESMELKTGGKTWKVYGSPVRPAPLACIQMCPSDSRTGYPSIHAWGLPI